jgi:hypothetical protein
MKRLSFKKLIYTLFKWMVAGLASGSVFLGAFSIQALAGVETSYLYNLSNFSGPIPFNWSNIRVDRERNEIYVADPHGTEVRVFNEKGMEIYRFGDDGSLGSVLDVAVESNGNILVLSRRIGKSSIIRCNFRGQALAEIELKGLSAVFSEFLPDRMVYRQNKLYLLDSGRKKIAVTDTNGFIKKEYNLYDLLHLGEKKQVQTDIEGFSVDRNGNMLFTIASLFSAFKLFPDGKIASFGKPGSAPGRFGVIGGIVADDKGYYYVADRLRCVVLIFDQDFTFQKEFGYRGTKPHNFIGPKNLGLGDKGRLYVSQVNNRGISVFKITYNKANN